MTSQKIVINDLLSFMVSKLKLTTRNKLLKNIESYYSDNEIEEAHQCLFESLPKFVTRPKIYRKMKRNQSILNFIYDCIEFTPHSELPVFVCKDLNNIPQFKDNKRDIKIEEKCNSESMESTDEVVDFDEDTINEVCRKEQKQMKAKISEMMAIIEELKSGLQKFLNIPEHSKISKNIRKQVLEIEREEEPVIKCEKISDLTSGLALIQKFIDEDADENISLMDQDTMDESMCSSYDIILEEIEGSENCVLTEKGNLNSDKQKILLKAENNEDITSIKSEFDSTEGLVGHKIISLSEEFDSSLKAHMEEKEDSSVILELKKEYIEDSNNTDSQSLPGRKEIDVSQANVRFDLRSCAPEKCPICDISYNSKSKYDQHAKSHYRKGTYDCALCNQCFNTREELVEHFVKCFREVKDYCNLEEHTCSVCGSFYADQTSLTKHKSFHSECRRFQCPKCTFRYFSKKGLNLHMKNQHNPMNKFICPLCDLSFLCGSFLNIHIAVHTGARPFTCNTCDHKTDSKKAIKQHLYTHSKNYVKKLRCNECCFTCEGSYLLLKHRLLQHRDPVRCPICEKSFKNPSSYRRHYETHKGKNKYKCHLCTYSSTFKRYLEKHALTHPSEMGFQCPKCSIPLSSKHTVGHHLRKYCVKREKTEM